MGKLLKPRLDILLKRRDFSIADVYVSHGILILLADCVRRQRAMVFDVPECVLE